MQESKSSVSPRKVSSAFFNHNTVEAFQSLFKHVGLDHDPTTIHHAMRFLSLYECFKPISEGVFNSINQSALSEKTNQFLIFTGFIQSCLLRPATTERVDLVDPKGLDLVALKESAQVLAMIDEIRPKRQDYASALVLGAFQKRLELRMIYLIQLIQQKVITGVHHILVSVGERQLKDFEPAKAAGAKTEFEMAKLVVEELKQKFPEVFQGISVDFHNAQKKPDSNRARTDDAAEETSKMYDQKDPVLIISNQPFIGYQHETHVLAFAPTPVETVGEAAEASYNGWNYCDAFSRYIYCTALRHLVVDCKMEAASARKLIDDYKAKFKCDSLLYQGGKPSAELFIDKQEVTPTDAQGKKL